MTPNENYYVVLVGAILLCVTSLANGAIGVGVETVESK